MKRIFLSLFLVCLLVSALPVSVHADTYYGGSDWRVAFTSQKKMDSNFRTADLDDAVSGLQPGDNIVFTMVLRNDYSEATDWWMTNEVLHSLEDSSANSKTHGGAYTYHLTYTDRAGEDIILFSSETVGGEFISAAGEGLHAATDAMEDYFYLDTLTTGEKGLITLEVALDGETQGNDYQDTLADLQMNFAVELNPNGDAVRRLREMDSDFTTRRLTDEQYELVDLDLSSSSATTRVPLTTDVVKTGDDTKMEPYAVAMAVSGILLLILAICSMMQSRKEKREAE